MKMIEKKNIMKNRNNHKRKIVTIGNCNMIDLTSLVSPVKYPQVRVLSIGNFGSCSKNTAHEDTNDEKNVNHTLSEIDFFVSSTFGEQDEVISSIKKLKEANPNMKIVLAESTETPRFPGSNLPPGVDLIAPVTKEQGQAGNAFLTNQVGLLTGIQGGLAVSLAALIASRAEGKTSIMLSLTNLNKDLLASLQI